MLVEKMGEMEIVRGKRGVVVRMKIGDDRM